ncbi:hypothetical protein GCM10025734_79440 [Kitasatospora paranensis]
MSLPTTARTMAATAAAVAGGLAVANSLPALTSLGPLRPLLAPGLSGPGAPGHVALTFDDGPDPRSTPLFLAALERAGVRATFFVLGRMLVRAPELGREMAAAGHEIAVHGYQHRPTVLRSPWPCGTTSPAPGTWSRTSPACPRAGTGRRTGCSASPRWRLPGGST